jgi:hypothetical protein
MEADDWALEELKLLQDSMLRIWQIYINWYTWFVGTSVVALSWMIARPEETSKSGLVEPVAAFLSFACVLGAVAGVAIGLHRRQTRKRATALSAKIVEHQFDPSVFLGGTITFLAVPATIATLIFLLVVWLGVGFGRFVGLLWR